MTDVPRRSYPLVVPAPGGFEDAVRRGRRRRHRRVGSTTGAALALVGVLAYSVMPDGPDPTAGIDTTNDPLPTAQPAPGLVPSSTPAPTATATPGGTRPGGPGTPVAIGPPPAGTVAPSPAAPGPVVRKPGDAPRENQPPERRYAPRNKIDESPRPELAQSTDCLPQDGKKWCAYARATKPEPDGTSWNLVYRLCRALDAGPGIVDFDRVQEAEYSVTAVQNQDTIWTYSAGQPVVRATDTTEVPAGHCVSWTVRWNGYDDFGFTPRPGQYVLRAVSTGTSDANLPTDTEPLTIG